MDEPKTLVLEVNKSKLPVQYRVAWESEDGTLKTIYVSRGIASIQSIIGRQLVEEKEPVIFVRREIHAVDSQS
jgi:hypothetical protein